MENIKSLREAVAAYQIQMQPLNNELDNPSINAKSRAKFESSLMKLKALWYDAMCDYHAHPEYEGQLAYEKENNPFK